MSVRQTGLVLKNAALFINLRCAEIPHSRASRLVGQAVTSPNSRLYRQVGFPLPLAMTRYRLKLDAKCLARESFRSLTATGTGKVPNTRLCRRFAGSPLDRS